MFVSLALLCVVYVVKEVGQIIGVARKRTRVRGSSSYRQARKIQKLLITVPYSRETVGIMQGSLTSKYNKLLSFRYEEIII